jgi:hypothetical protein
MCVNCVFNSVQQGATGSGALPALFAASASALGMRKLGNRLLALEVRRISERRVKAAIALVLALGLIAVASAGSGGAAA